MNDFDFAELQLTIAFDLIVKLRGQQPQNRETFDEIIKRLNDTLDIVAQLRGEAEQFAEEQYKKS